MKTYICVLILLCICVLVPVCGTGRISRSGPLRIHTALADLQLLLHQYLYFCTDTASKLSTFSPHRLLDFQRRRIQRDHLRALVALRDIGAVLLVYAPLSFWCMRPSATSVCGLKLLVYEALSY